MCGGFICGGVIESNMYPNAYPANQDCRWEISMNAGVLVELEFLAFDIKYSRDCKEQGYFGFFNDCEVSFFHFIFLEKRIILCQSIKHSI